jgi:hypothetical protein
MTWLWVALFVVVLLIGWLLTVIGLPGNWVNVVAVALYAWLLPEAGRATIGWPIVAVVLALATLGELLEFLAGAAGVAKVGGSRPAAVLALVGSIGGGIAGMFVGVPVPVVGPIVAAILFAAAGALSGAMFGEIAFSRSNLQRSWDVGKGAFWGRLLGTLSKTIAGAVMVVVAVVALLV